MTGWVALLGSFRAVFTAPSFAIFTDLLTGWVCAPGRRTVTAMIAVADPAGRRAHDAYHRLPRDSVWSMSALWRGLCVHAVARFAPNGVVELVCDDTLHHKTGRHVDGAGTFRDAVRSTVKKVVYAHGLNLVVICLRVHAPWGGCPIAIPVNARLHRKNEQTTTIKHAANMLREIAGWLPHRALHLTADGADATLARDLPDRVRLTCRMRRDAALFEAARAAGALASAFHAKATTATVRTQLIAVPVRLAHSARGQTLHLPEGWAWQDAWQSMFDALHAPPQAA